MAFAIISFFQVLNYKLIVVLLYSLYDEFDLYLICRRSLRDTRTGVDACEGTPIPFSARECYKT